MPFTQSNIPAADYLVNRDPWLRRFGGRQAGKRISEQLYECCPPILRGRPIYDRLPGAAQAYNKDQDTFITKGTIILPEAKTVISSAEDLYFRTKFPSEYEERDYVSGSFLGPGSAAALFEGTNQAVKVGDNVANINILLRSAIFFWGEDRVRDDTNIAKKTIDFPGAVIQINPVTSGWIWIDGNGVLNITEGLPDGVANLSGNIWCDQNFDPALGQQACVERINVFERLDNYKDVLDVGDTSETVTWPPDEECEFATFNEVAPLFYFITDENGTITTWDDYRLFNTTFDPPLARYLMDYWDNLLQDKREQIDVFIDDALIPDTVGKQYITCDSVLRRLYREEIVDKILDSWDFGLINTETKQTIFNFLGSAELLELAQYDNLTHTWLDWLAQHFGLQDNETLNTNVWHRGSHFERQLQEGEVYFTIAEKRAILRNALGQDPFQTLADAGTFVEDFPIWNLVTDFWDLTELFWNSTGLVPSGEEEFVFTRFPFTTYNRIKPANWQGLMKEKGTKKALEFMFDVLGLHGYACTTDGPRFDLSQADFRTPLIPFKFANSVVIENRKQLNADGTITDIVPLEPRIGNYAETGYVRTGETILMQGYDKKLVVRAPFAWDRLGQQYNRLTEISRAWIREGELVTGYYNFLTGLSAAGEPVWKAEECTACKYVGTTWHSYSEDKSTLSDWYNNTDEYMNEEWTWIQNVTKDNLWKGIGFDRNPNFRNQDASYPIYVDNRRILAINYLNTSFQGGSPYAQENGGDVFPVIVSNDNGYSFEPLIPANVPDVSNTFAVSYKSPRKLRHTGLRTHLVDKKGILESLDDGETWNELINYTQEIDFYVHDVFRDEDRRRTYIASDNKIFGKIDGETTFTELFELTRYDEEDSYFTDAVMRSDGKEVVTAFVESKDNACHLVIHSTSDFGVTNFQELRTGPLMTENDVYDYKIRGLQNSLFKGDRETSYVFLFAPDAYSGENYSLFSRNQIREINEETEFYNLLNDAAALDRPPYVNQVLKTHVTDIKQNLRNNRFEYFTTTTLQNKRNIASPGDPTNYYYETEIVGEIYSSNIAFTDVQREQTNFKLAISNQVDVQTTTNDFIIKQQQLEDITASPITEEVTYNAYNSEQICSECGPGGTPLFEDVPVTEYTLYIPVIDTIHPTPGYPDTFHANESNEVYLKSVAIHAQDYISGFTQVHWELPKDSPILKFNIASNDIASATGRQFTPLEIPPVNSRFDPNYPGRYETLEVYSDFVPVREYQTGEYIKNDVFEPVFVNLVGYSGTDVKTVTFKLIPIYGHYYNNYDAIGGAALPYNQITITFADIWPDAVYPNQGALLNLADIDEAKITVRELHHPIVRDEISWSFGQIGTTSMNITIDAPFDTDTQYELSWQADIILENAADEILYQTSIKIHHEAP